MKQIRQETVELINLCLKVTDSDFQKQTAGILDFYLQNGYLSGKQKKIIFNTINFKCLNV